MPKKFKSIRRALRRGHLALFNTRDKDGNIHSSLCETHRRFGPANYKKPIMYLGMTPGDKQENTEN